MFTSQHQRGSQMRALLGRTVVLGMAAILAGCGDDDGFSPTVETVAGSYSAASFTLGSPAGTIDLLALGSVVTVTLDADGSTTGQLFVPGGAEDGGDLDADLTGTWSLDGTTVTFNQTADTFIRDAQFTAGENRLTGEGTFSGQTIRLVMTKPG
jgi:hypothetical protein